MFIPRVIKVLYLYQEDNFVVIGLSYQLVMYKQEIYTRKCEMCFMVKQNVEYGYKNSDIVIKAIGDRHTETLDRQENDSDKSV